MQTRKKNENVGDDEFVKIEQVHVLYNVHVRTTVEATKGGEEDQNFA